MSEDTGPATSFRFTIPPISRDQKMQVQAPNGVTIKIGMPAQAEVGDELEISKDDATHQWRLTNIIKTGVPKKTAKELEDDLAGPGVVTVKFETTKGPILMKIVPAWSPLGARRFLELVDDGFYDQIAIYRGIEDFLVQFGVTKEGTGKTYTRISDDMLVGVPYLDGMVGFAAAGPMTRQNTVCFFLADIPYLGKQSVETPMGKICPESMATLHSLTLLGDIPQCGGNGPDPANIAKEGNEYVKDKFPNCDFITSASRVS